jgi:hypothetical protein
MDRYRAIFDKLVQTALSQSIPLNTTSEQTNALIDIVKTDENDKQKQTKEEF